MQVLELSRQQEITKQAEMKKKEEEARLQAAAYKVVGDARACRAATALPRP